MKRIVIIIAVLLTSCITLSAQRTAQGEMALYADFTTPLRTGWGASIGYNYYTMIGFLEAEVSVSKRILTASRENEETFVTEFFKMSPTHISARAGYMVRLASTRDRMFNLYAGGGILLGAGVCATDDRWTIFNDQFGTDFYGTVSYALYGVYPKLEIEVFVFDHTALDLSFRAPLTALASDYNTIQDTIGLINPELSAGVKFNF